MKSSRKSETPKAATNGASSEKTLSTMKALPMADSTSTPSSFDFHGNSVRVVLRDGEPWFVATDICRALDYSNPSKAIADHLDDDERYNQSLDRGGSLLLINESGLYALVLRSRKPEARKFAKWVTNEVLPSIRKTGSYSEPITPIPNREPGQTLQTFIERMTLYITDQGYTSAHYFEPIAIALANRTKAFDKHFIRVDTQDQVNRLVWQLRRKEVRPAELMDIVNEVLSMSGFNIALPSDQARAIQERLDRVASIFHPENSTQFHDIIAVKRLLRGRDPVTGYKDPYYRSVVNEWEGPSCQNLAAEGAAKRKRSEAIVAANRRALTAGGVATA